LAPLEIHVGIFQLVYGAMTAKFELKYLSVFFLVQESYGFSTCVCECLILMTVCEFSLGMSQFHEDTVLHTRFVTYSNISHEWHL
jgi:hypothetical protein